MKNYSVLINYVELFETITYYNGAILEENAKEIFSNLFNDNVQDKTTVSHLIDQDILQEISKNYSNLN